MRIANLLGGILVSVFVLTGAPAAQANPITFSYFGTVTSLSDPNNTLGGSAGVGSTFMISFTFDPLVPDFVPLDPLIGLYQWTDPSLTMRITIGSSFFEYQMSDTRTQNDLEISPGVFADSYFPRSFEPGTAGPGLTPMLAEFVLTQIDPAASLLTSDALPLTPPDPTLANVTNRFQFSNTNGLSFEGTLRPAFIEVTIDIKPGGDPNAINPRSKGVIPVAILTTDTFDATTVSPITVQFGPAGASPEHQLGHLEDVDSDGDLDLVLHFRTQESGIQCGDTEASLSGQTFDGGPFQSSDSIVTVGCS